MSTDVNSPAAESSSPAPVSLPRLESLSPSDLQAWRQTGKLPESPSPESLAASTPAEPVEQAASTDATQQPASEPGVPEIPAKPRKNAETRKEELNREIRDLLARRDAANREADEAIRRRDGARAPAEPDPPRPAVTASSITPDITKEPLTEEEFFELEGASIGHYSLYLGRYAALEQDARREQTTQMRTRQDAFEKRVNEDVTVTPDFLASIPRKLWHSARLDRLPADVVPGPMNVVQQEIYESDHPGLLMRHFADHPEELDALERLTSQAAVVRAVAKIEAKIATPSAPVVQVKTQSSAPPPPTTLGRRPALVSDELESAVKEGDFSRFKAEGNRRERAALAG